jgi:hypothetical protein
MPKLYEYIGYTFFFYTNEHKPRHIHVKRGEKLMKVELEDEQGNQKSSKGTLIVLFKKIKSFKNFNSKEKREISRFVNNFREDILGKWDKVINEKKVISSVKVNAKLRKENILDKILNLRKNV